MQEAITKEEHAIQQRLADCPPLIMDAAEKRAMGDTLSSGGARCLKSNCVAPDVPALLGNAVTGTLDATHNTMHVRKIEAVA
jgi:hypothetical protein